MKAEFDDIISKRKAGTRQAVLIELCCSKDSELGASVSTPDFAVRVTEDDDILSSDTRAVLRDSIDRLFASGFDVFAWTSTPAQRVVHGSV